MRDKLLRLVEWTLDNAREFNNREAGTLAGEALDAFIDECGEVFQLANPVRPDPDKADRCDNCGALWWQYADCAAGCGVGEIPWVWNRRYCRHCGRAEESYDEYGYRTVRYPGKGAETTDEEAKS